MDVPIVRHGDPTTTRGKVVAFTATIQDNGRTIALSGDQATCGNCKGLWKIFGSGEGAGEGGRDVVIRGDRVLCPCGRNRVIAGADAGMFLHIEATMANTAAGSAAQALADTGQYNEQFTLRDAKGSTLANTYYTIESQSSLIHGVTDWLGRTERHVTDGAQDVRIYLGHRESI